MGQTAKQREQELKDATGLIRAMREVTMVTGGNGEDSEAIKTETREQRRPTHSGPEHQQAAGMQKDELRRREVIQPHGLCCGGFRPIRGEHPRILTFP